MSKNKSFFQKLSDSLSNIFPFNSTTREDVSQVSLDRNLSPITYPNRRLASEAFGRDDDEFKVKRARLHYDLKSLPTSRIIKPLTSQLPNRCNAFNNNFNDAESDFSDTSNVSVSTSGVSSLHPRSSKRFNLVHSEDIPMQINYKYPRNLNVSQKVNSPISQMSLKQTKDFISSPARKILEKLDRLTTPVTAADKLTTLLVRDKTPINNLNKLKPYNPYGRPIPPICRKNPVPIKAVTVSATSKEPERNCGPIRCKSNSKMKKLGYYDEVDLDSELIASGHNYPNLNDSTKINLSNIPMLKKSVSTNTVESSFTNKDEPDLEFSFRAPHTINDEEYQNRTIVYEFKSIVSENEIIDSRKRNDILKKLWRCDTCYTENSNESVECINCENISNKNTIVISDKAVPTSFDKSNLLKKILENENEQPKAVEFPLLDESNKSSTPNFNVTPNTVSLASIDSELTIFNTKTSSMSIDSANVSLGIGSFSFSPAVTSSVSLGQTSIYEDTKVKNSSSGSISKPISFEQTTNSLFNFGQTSSTGISLSLTASNLNTTPKIEYSSVSTPMSSSSLVVTVTSPTFSFGQAPTASIFKSSSSDIISSFQSSTLTSTSTSKLFTFGQMPTTELSSIKSVSLDQKVEPLSFGHSFIPMSTGGLLSSSTISSNVESSKPLAFVQVSDTGLLFTSAKVTEVKTSKPLTFGQMLSTDLSTITKVTTTETTKPPTFGQVSSTGFLSSKAIVTDVEPSKLSFGHKPSTGLSSSNTVITNAEPLKLFPFGNMANAGVPDTKITTDAVKALPFGQMPIFGLTSSNTTITNVENSKSVSFGQIPNTGMSSTDLFNSKSFSFNPNSNVDTKSFTPGLTSNTCVTSSIFCFGQKSDVQVSTSSFTMPTTLTKPSVFSTPSIFGTSIFDTSNSFEVTTTSAMKSSLFGQKSNTGGINSSPVFSFGQSSNSTTSEIAKPFSFSQALTKSESSTSLFGNNPKASTSSSSSYCLFGTNGTNNRTSNLFGVNSNSMTNESNKSQNSFSFAPQNASSTGNTNIISTGFSFNSSTTTTASASAMNLSQQSSSVPSFSITNNASQSNLFNAVTNSNSFTFSGGEHSNNKSNMFGSSTGNSSSAALVTGAATAATGTGSSFNFSSNTPVFQFGGNTNGSTQSSNAPGNNNQRRLLKVRRRK